MGRLAFGENALALVALRSNDESCTQAFEKGEKP
jgi:hypothetical protein